MLSKFKAIAAVILVLIIGSGRTSEATFLYEICPNTTTFTPNSTYQKNLNQLLFVLSSNATRPNGFYNTTTGINDPSNSVYGLFLCRGDVTTSACQQCVDTASKKTIEDCPVEKVSTIWYDECLLRYSDVSIFSTAATTPIIYMHNVANVSDPTRFKQVLDNTLGSLVQEVANGGSDKKFGTKEAQFSSQTIYTLGQCTPDLSVLDCNECLQEAVRGLPYTQAGGRVLFPSCYVRYEFYIFYTPAPAPPPTLKSPPPVVTPTTGVNHKGGVSSVIIVVIVVAIVVAIVLAVSLFFLGCWLKTKRVKKKPELVPQEDDDMSAQESLQFGLAIMREATNNFSIDNKLGEGGFGQVYKGTLPNGQDIAVKRLSRSSRQGAGEFKTEVLLVAKLQHRNLVRLLGFCFEGEEKLLVYEFVPNKSLDNLLFDPEKQGQLDWSTRYKIITGIARGMLYLHEDSRLRIIHRDLKVSNILLDGDLNPKISDFGMAKIFGVDQTQGNTSRIMGTYGYMSPEYAMHGQFSIKSDVYSFGVLVLEIISGKKNSSFGESGEAANLMGYAWQLWRDGMPLELLDSNLRDCFSPNELMRCIHIALLCVQEDPNERPTMQSIVLVLNSYSITLGTPQRPGFLLHSRSQPSYSTSKEFESDKSAVHQSLPVSVNEASITDVYPR